MNRYIADNRKDDSGNDLTYSDVFEKTFCGQTYACAEYTSAGFSGKRLIAYCEIESKVFAMIEIDGSTAEICDSLTEVFVAGAF